MAEIDLDVVTAFHEAGHAVVALALGRAIQQVSILPDETRLGVCKIKKGCVRPSDDDLKREIMICLAGMAAEARVTGRYCNEGAAQDLRYVRAMCLARAGNEKRAERLERRMLDKVEHLLDQPGHWRATELIAEELRQRTTISGRAARHHFDAATAGQER